MIYIPGILFFFQFFNLVLVYSPLFGAQKIESVESIFVSFVYPRYCCTSFLGLQVEALNKYDDYSSRHVKTRWLIEQPGLMRQGII